MMSLSEAAKVGRDIIVICSCRCGFCPDVFNFRAVCVYSPRSNPDKLQCAVLYAHGPLVLWSVNSDNSTKMHVVILCYKYRSNSNNSNSEKIKHLSYART